MSAPNLGTVREVMEYLFTQDPDAIVSIETWDGDYSVSNKLEAPATQSLPGYVNLYLSRGL